MIMAGLLSDHTIDTTPCQMKTGMKMRSYIVGTHGKLLGIRGAHVQTMMVRQPFGTGWALELGDKTFEKMVFWATAHGGLIAKRREWYVLFICHD